MFGSLGGWELLLIFALALLLFGPRKLPQIGRSVGKALSEFRSATNEFKSTLEREVDLEKVRETRDDLTAVGVEVQRGVRDVTRLGVARSDAPATVRPDSADAAPSAPSAPGEQTPPAAPPDAGSDS